MLPWRVVNAVDDVRAPEGFTPIQECTPDLPGTATGVGCSCSPACGTSCPCGIQEPWGRVYDDEGCLIPVSLGVDVESSLRECGPGCACRGACTPARTPRPVAMHLERMPGKGWGVIVDEDLPAGRFICEYVGERITTDEVRRRLAAYDAAARGHALLVFREILPSGQASLRLNIDATRKGNIAAFFNHSCNGGNLQLQSVIRAGSMVPAVCLFAKRRVRAGEELALCYGDPMIVAGLAQARCLCRTAACRGFLPRQAV